MDAGDGLTAAADGQGSNSIAFFAPKVQLKVPLKVHLKVSTHDILVLEIFLKHEVHTGVLFKISYSGAFGCTFGCTSGCKKMLLNWGPERRSGASPLLDERASRFDKRKIGVKKLSPASQRARHFGHEDDAETGMLH